MRVLPIIGVMLASYLLPAIPTAQGEGEARFYGGPADGHSGAGTVGPPGTIQAGWHVGGSGDGFALSELLPTVAAARQGWYAGSSGDGHSSALSESFERAAWGRWFAGGAGDGQDCSTIAGFPNPLDRDSDGDGLPDWWELPHFGGITNAVPGGDYDKDGATDGDEYVALTDPRRPESVFRIVSLAESNGFALVTIPCSEQRVYDLYARTNLVRETWMAVNGRTNLPGEADGNLTIDAEALAPAHFYSVRVRLP
jgi:hypothetical protein